MVAKNKVVDLNLVRKRTANSAVASGSHISEEEQEFLSDLRGIVWAEAGRINGSWKGLI